MSCRTPKAIQNSDRASSVSLSLDPSGLREPESGPLRVACTSGGLQLREARCASGRRCAVPGLTSRKSTCETICARNSVVGIIPKMSSFYRGIGSRCRRGPKSASREPSYETTCARNVMPAKGYCDGLQSTQRASSGPRKKSDKVMMKTSV